MTPPAHARTFYLILVLFNVNFVINLVFSHSQKAAQELLGPHQAMTGDQLLILLQTAPQTRTTAATNLGMGPTTVTVVETVTLLKMVIPHQDPTPPADAAPLTDCHLHHRGLALLVIGSSF